LLRQNPTVEQVLKLINEENCDVNELNPFGTSPLRIAITERARLEVVNLLLEKGATVYADRNGWTPLHTVVMHDVSEEIYHAIVNAGVDIDAQTNDVSRFFVHP
jgi:ankyrin repeat protein